MLDSFLGYDPFGGSRTVTRRAAQPEPEDAPKLPSGFTMLPGGNLMYAVADDPEKLYAQAAAEYEARAKSPRINGLDNPDRLYKELFAPLDEVYRQSQNTGVQNRIVEGPDGIYAVDPYKGTSSMVQKYPAKPEPELSPAAKLEYADLLSQRRNLQTGVIGSTGGNAEKVAALDATIEAFKKAHNLSAQPAVAQPSVAAAAPKLYFGPQAGDPFSGPDTRTNRTGVIQTKSGKTYKISTD